LATGALDLGAPILDASDGSDSIIADGVVEAAGFKKTVLVPTATNQGSAIIYDWLEPFAWEAAQIAAVDSTSMIIYEGLFLGLQWLWDNLRWEVHAYAQEQFKNQENEAQQEKIDEHTVRRVPDENEPEPTEDLDDGITAGVADEGVSEDM
jgi:hypothetical protein